MGCVLITHLFRTHPALSGLSGQARDRFTQKASEGLTTINLLRKRSPWKAQGSENPRAFSCAASVRSERVAGKGRISCERKIRNLPSWTPRSRLRSAPVRKPSRASSQTSVPAERLPEAPPRLQSAEQRLSPAFSAFFASWRAFLAAFSAASRSAFSAFFAAFRRSFSFSFSSRSSSARTFSFFFADRARPFQPCAALLTFLEILHQFVNCRENIMRLVNHLAFDMLLATCAGNSVSPVSIESPASRKASSAAS